MPANIEIKARARNFVETKNRAEALSDTSVEVIPQDDTFFNVPRGRLKLRVLAPQRGQLIYYERVDREGPKRSEYQLVHTSDPGNLKCVLEHAYGIRGIVRKTRYLYLVGQTRVHFDDVEGLGQFIELEVVLREGQSDEEGGEIAHRLMTSLGVQRGDLIEGAYMDLIESSSTDLH